jgi:hypothetical protein
VGIVRKAAIVRGTSRHSLSSQIDMARRADCDVIFVLGRKTVNASDLRYCKFEDAVRTFRRQDEIYLPFPYVIADPARCKRGKVREYFDECMEAIEDRGPAIIDLHNKLRSDDKAQWRLMMKLGRNGAANSGKGIASAENAKKGRKVTAHAPEVEAQAKAIWLNRRDYPKWKDVEAALPKGVTKEYCYRNKEWGGARTRKRK